MKIAQAKQSDALWFSIKALFIFSGIIFLAGLMFALRQYRELPNSKEADVAFQRRALSGDFVAGYLGTTMSTVSVVLLVATILMQHRDSKEQEHKFQMQLNEERLRSDREHLLQLITRISQNIYDTTDARDRGNIWHENADAFEYACAFAYKQGELHGNQPQFIALLKAAPRLFAIQTAYRDGKKNNKYVFLRKFIEENTSGIA